jgi:metallo-beta-lactamase class B
MKSIAKTLLIVVISISANCTSQKGDAFKPVEVYKSKDLIVLQIAENSFKHTSFLQTNDFGNVPCNGLMVRNNNEVVVFDTPTTDKSADAVVPTHFHDDCLGGLKAFHENDIQSYAYFKTVELAIANNMVVPKNSFQDSLILKVGNESSSAVFFGEGHTKDNVVGYFPVDDVLFGGCLIKELDASKGFLGDATLAEWSNTVERIKKQYPNLKIVVPGHGQHGDKKLLDYTIKLFKNSI